MKIKEIQNLIKFVAKSGASEVSLEMEDVKITIKTNDSAQPVVIHDTATVPQPVVLNQPVSPQPSQVQANPLPVEEDSNYITIKSPIIGTFYRKPSPDKPNFVEVGPKAAFQ